MTKWMLAAGAAALAIVSPALAQKGGGKDKGNQGQKADGGAKAQGGGKADRGAYDQGGQPMRMDRGGGKSRADRQQYVQRDDRGGRGNDKVRGKRGYDGFRIARDDHNGNKSQGANRQMRKVDRFDDRGVRIARNGHDDGGRFLPSWNQNGLARGFDNGCPPGLAKKHNGCMPPGQAKKLVGTLLPATLSNNMLAGPYSQWYRDNNDFFYRNDGDYIYRVRRNGGLIDALFPSANRDFSYYPVGMNYPSDYNFYNVPNQYSSFYPDGGNYAYRYGNGAIYQVNPSNGLIQGIAALLAGDLAVGQRLPQSYGAYNLPLGYRDQYYDTANDMYRYNDGYIYRVDPTTRLITAVINALV